MIPKESKLYQALLILSNKAIELAIDHKRRGNLITIQYQFTPVSEINFETETYQYNWEGLSYFDVFEWESMKLADVIKNEINKSSEYQDAVKAICEEFTIPEGGAFVGLFSLINHILQEAPNERINKKNIEDYIELFINDFESNRNDRPTTWNLQLWLGNIFIESDEIEISQDVFLKRPTIEQLADVKLKQNYISELDRITSRRLGAGAILYFSVQVPKKFFPNIYPEIITTEIENWLNLLRLFKPTDITVLSQIINPVSILEYGVSERKEHPSDQNWKGKIPYQDTSTFKLRLHKSDENHLKELVKRVKPSLINFSPKTYLNGDYHDLAFHRYNDALLKSEVNVYRILSAMTSIEALLTNETTEIAFKVRQRVAKLVSYFDFDPIMVSEHIKMSYTVRSKLVHGSSPVSNNNLQEFSRKHIHDVLNYNRICLCISLQLKNIISKSDLIKKIDNAFIDLRANEELKMLIKENVVLPIQL